MHPEVFALVAVSRFNDKKFRANAQKLVAISRAGRNSIERIACVDVREVFTPN